MGISIYYSVTRSTPLTEQEREAVQAVAARYSVGDQFEEHHRTGIGWEGEDFCLYAPPFDSPETILEGATKLPMNSEDVFWEAIQHWCRALSEIRHLLDDADWHVHIDDHEIRWDEQLSAFDPTE